MADDLEGLAVLVAEDEYMIAHDLARELGRAGARVIGPAPSLDRTMDLIAATDRIDGAILDVSLQGEKVFPAAEMLEARGIPFLFATGYDPSVIPPRFGSILRCEKPIGPGALRRALAGLIGSEGR